MSGQQISTLLMRGKKEHKAQIIFGSVTRVITAHEKANNELTRKTSSHTHLHHFQLFQLIYFLVCVSISVNTIILLLHAFSIQVLSIGLLSQKKQLKKRNKTANLLGPQTDSFIIPTMLTLQMFLSYAHTIHIYISMCT